MQNFIFTFVYYFSFTFHNSQTMHVCYQKGSWVGNNNCSIIATYNAVMWADNSMVLTQHLHNGQ